MLARSRLAYGVGVAWMLIIIIATSFGAARLDRYRADVAQVRAVAQHERAALERQILERDPVARMPLSAEATILVPPGPLMDIVAGRSPLEPTSAAVNMWTLSHLMFSNYQTSNPRELAAGAFDPGFVIIYLMPLLLVVLGYSALTLEYDSGLGRMLCAQGISLTRLLWARLLARAALIVLPLLLALVVMTLLQPITVDRGMRMAVTVGSVVAYAVVWVSATACCLARVGGGTRALLYLFIAWVGVALLIPAVLGACVQLVHPLPSRLDLLATARRTEIEAYRQQGDLLRAYAEAHRGTKLVDSATAPLWQKGVVAVTDAIERSTTAARSRFEQQWLAQQNWVEHAQYLSPTLTLQRTLGRLAGTDEARFLAVHQQAAVYLQTLRADIADLTFSDEPLTVAKLRGLPAFNFPEPAWASALIAVSGPLAWFVAISAVLCGASRVRLPTTAS